MIYGLCQSAAGMMVQVILAFAGGFVEIPNAQTPTRGTIRKGALLRQAPGGARIFAALRSVGRKPDAQDPQVIWQAASQAVAQLFFGPRLAEMRKLPFGREFDRGGRTEEVFGEQLDMRIADAVADADRGGLTSQLAERLRQGVGGRRPTAAGADRMAWPAEVGK